jgi:nitrite reductase (NADH) small subunit
VQVHIDDSESFTDGEIRVIHAAGRKVAVIRWGDTFYAVRNVCPHAGASLCSQVRALLAPTGQPGDFEVRADRPVVACASHHFEFELGTGRCVVDANLRVKTYPIVADENGRLAIDIDGSA